MKERSPLLQVRGLRTVFETGDGVLCAVDGVDFDVEPGEVFGLVGESGCGKTVTALSILRLVPVPGQIAAGQIHFEGISILELSDSEVDQLRGRRITMIFQDPQQRLNPVFTMGAQLAEVYQVHSGLGRKDAVERSLEMFKLVGISDPERFFHSYPHEISGGQAQRVMIAMALAMEPDLIIADEPTSALDVTIQAQILDMIKILSSERGTAVILISHDLGVIAGMADRVAVMYAGRIVEIGDVDSLYRQRFHPYTQGLIASLPRSNQANKRLRSIPGQVPDPLHVQPGCRFAPRCAERKKYNLLICESRDPDLREIRPGYRVRCWLYQEAAGHVPPLGDL